MHSIREIVIPRKFIWELAECESSTQGFLGHHALSQEWESHGGKYATREGVNKSLLDKTPNFPIKNFDLSVC